MGAFCKCVSECWIRRPIQFVVCFSASRLHGNKHTHKHTHTGRQADTHTTATTLSRLSLSVCACVLRAALPVSLPPPLVCPWRRQQPAQPARPDSPILLLGPSPSLSLTRFSCTTQKVRSSLCRSSLLSFSTSPPIYNYFQLSRSFARVEPHTFVQLQGRSRRRVARHSEKRNSISSLLSLCLCFGHSETLRSPSSLSFSLSLFLSALLCSRSKRTSKQRAGEPKVCSSAPRPAVACRAVHCVARSSSTITHNWGQVQRSSIPLLMSNRHSRRRRPEGDCESPSP